MAMRYEFRTADLSVRQAARFALAVLFGGGIGAFVRTYRAWRRYQIWFAWQGAGWFLLLPLTVLTMSLSAFG